MEQIKDLELEDIYNQQAEKIKESMIKQLQELKQMAVKTGADITKLNF